MMVKSRLYISILAFSIFAASCKDNDTEEPVNEERTENSSLITEKISFKLVNTFPHNSRSYTEGLQYVDGIMYESGGHYGQSFIAKTKLETGEVIKSVPLDARYFGEGLTVMGDKIYVLTYQEREGLVFDKESMKLLQTFPLNTNEGWGLTNDSTYLIYSDGSAFLYYLDPATFKEVKRVEVKDKFGAVSAINELEYINGFIYANQWQTEFILKIDPATGSIVAQADLAALRTQGSIPQPTPMNEAAPEVLNGIAYDKENNRIFVTGKNWPKIFEVKLDN